MSNIQIGKQYGQLTPIRLDTESNSVHKCYICECTCGKQKSIRAAVIGVKYTSCGCMHEKKKKEQFANRKKNKPSKASYITISRGEKKQSKKPEDPDIDDVRRTKAALSRVLEEKRLRAELNQYDVASW